MTGSGDGPSGADGGDGDEAVDPSESLDALQPVSMSLRSVQQDGREMDESADAAEEQSDGDTPETNPDGLNEPAPVSSSLRSAQSRSAAGDADGTDDGVEASDGKESGNA